MYKTNQLLDMVKAEYDLPSDYALAKKLELTRGMISNYRKELNFPSSKIAYNIAKLLLLNPLVVVASVEHERATFYEDETMQKFWEDAAKI